MHTSAIPLRSSHRYGDPVNVGYDWLEDLGCRVKLEMVIVVNLSLKLVITAHGTCLQNATSHGLTGTIKSNKEGVTHRC